MSIEMNSIEYAMGFTGMRNVFSMNEDDIRKWLRKHRRYGSLACPAYFEHRYRRTDKFFRGRLCMLLTPRRRTKQENSWLLYIHGGGYTLEMNILEWRFLYRLALRTGMSIAVPCFPSAPQHDCRDTMKMVYSVYTYLLKRTEGSHIRLIGTSSGGGIALSLAQLLKKKGMRTPHDLILLSPILNLNIPNDEEWRRMQHIAPHDKLLSPEIFYMLGKWWGNGVPRSSYLVSPYYGPLKDIGKVSVFSGTHDVLNVSANELYKKALNEGVSIDLYEFVGMPHMWFLFPGPESRNAFRTILDIIRD